MRNCPVCKNKDFKGTEGFTKPLIHKGKKNFATFSIRYYYCMSCGSRLKTVEKLQEVIQELELFPADLENEPEDE